MAKLIDLEELKQKGLAETWPIDLNQQGVGPSFLLPEDTTPRERTYYDEGMLSSALSSTLRRTRKRGSRKAKWSSLKAAGRNGA